MSHPPARFRRNQKPVTPWMLALASVAALALDYHVARAAENPASTMKLTLKIGSKSFTASLEDNATTKAFKALLPVTVRMTELNGNEKYYRFSEKLPTYERNPGTIQEGDVMLYGPSTLVLFYKTFSTPYTYTRLGRIDDPAGLAAALGSGDVTVTYELQEKPKAN